MKEGTVVHMDDQACMGSSELVMLREVTVRQHRQSLSVAPVSVVASKLASGQKFAAWSNVSMGVT